MINFIHIYAFFGCVITSTVCCSLSPYFKKCLEKYDQFENRDDIEYEFTENTENKRNNNDFIP
jgi:hypothetical protein